MNHLIDSEAWKESDIRYHIFVIDPQNVRLGLVADGSNMFGKMVILYNIWPVVLSTYNIFP